MLPDRLDSSGLQAAVARNKRKTEVKGSRSDDAVGHIRNNVPRYGPQSAGNVVIERNNFERGTVLVQLAHESFERIGCDAAAFD
jgi:hypothetical protein